MEGPASKLFQRKLYSWLSSRRGLPLCILGLLVLAISAFQFGEVLLEWSKERYAAQFSIYHDNIAGTSFERYMTPELPIDIVFTWVNGSDPRLLAELNALKRNMASSNDKKESSSKKDSGNSTKVARPTVTECPFKRCIPWKALLIDATNLSSSLTLSSFHQKFPSLKDDALDVMFLNSSTKHVSPVYAVKMASEDKVSSHLLSPIITSHDGLNVSLTRGFMTSDVTLVGGVPLNTYLMITSPILFPGNNTLHDLLLRRLEALHIGTITEVDIVIRGVGVVLFSKINTEKLLANFNVTFLNNSLNFHYVHAVWLPFTLDGNIESKSDIISSNRFQDNEELRYSLRSIEKYAPWVRHIYIVTNGQIPHWINLDNPRLSIVPHEDIYVNKSHLPSYSSPSIESHLHRIPGLSKWFLYLNDDVLFGQEVWPHDFFTPDGGQKVYLSWAVPNCNDGCPSNWINDRYCDAACNVSACDWDGDDCVNATRPGPVGGYKGHSAYAHRPTDYCSTGCLNTWVGDRYCDNACNVFTCGYDAGDCGIDKFNELYGITLTPSTNNMSFTLPLETSAMFFNLSSIFNNGTITKATHTYSPVIRTAVIAQKYKILSLTLSNNVSRNSSHFTITGKIQGETKKIELIVIADTVTVNSSLAHMKVGAVGRWSFPNYPNVTNSKFINDVSVKIQNHDSSIVSWITEKPTMSSLLTPPTVSTLINYTVSNISLLPGQVKDSLTKLETEWKEGDLTLRGYLKKKVTLLEPYSHLPIVHMNTVHYGTSAKNSNSSDSVTKNSNDDSVTKNSNDDSVTKKSNNADHPSRGRSELSHKGRNLLSLSTSWLPWERYEIFPPEEDSLYDTPTHKGRRLLDTFADSLRYVNMLYTRQYGHHARKVPAHMPHMINKVVMEELQTKYAQQFDMTSSHRLRHAHDMQFSFSYFYYIIGEKETVPLSEIFQQLDTDKSGILSVRELRTLLVRIMDIPLTSAKIDTFETTLRECSQSYNHSLPSIDPLEYETHYDPELPLVTLEFLGNCTELMKKINKTFGARNKYKYMETGEDHVQFKMLTYNSSKVLTKLDEVRKKQSKFICLNDNLDHTKEDTKLAALILVDFYESLFPIPSQFELPPNYRNKFLYVEDLRKWSHTRWTMQVVLQVTCAGLILLCIVSLFYGKIVKLKRRLTRFFFNCLHGTSRPHRVSTV